MHPLEHLRYLARAGAFDAATLLEEASMALSALLDDHAGLVITTRRLVEKHPACAPLYWLCAHVIEAATPRAELRARMQQFQHDATASVVADRLASDASVLVVGWPRTAGEALVRRGDVAVTVVADPDADTYRSLRRAGIDADIEMTLVSHDSVGAMVPTMSAVLVEAVAASPSSVLATKGSLAAASVAYCMGVPVWVVVPEACLMPAAAFEAMVANENGDVPSQASLDVVPFELATEVVRPQGAIAVPAVLAPDCRFVPGLLR